MPGILQDVHHWDGQIKQAANLAFMPEILLMTADNFDDATDMQRVISFLLPASLRCVIMPPTLAVLITPDPKTFAGQLLTAVTGKPSQFRNFEGTIAKRNDLSLVLWWYLVCEGNHQKALIEGIRAANNSAGYLAKALPALCEQFDEIPQVSEDQTEPTDNDGQESLK